jgi:nitrate reductase NapE component
VQHAKNRRNLITVLSFVIAPALSAAKVGHHGSFYGYTSGG